MRRRAKRRTGKVKARQPVARKSVKTDGSGRAQLEKHLAEAREQQAATSEILRVISESPTDVQPVFDTIVESAVRLCRADVGNVTRFDGEWIHLAAIRADPVGAEQLRRIYPSRPSGALASLRSIRDGALVHIPDVLEDQEHEAHDAATAAGFRAMLSVPLLRDGQAIGSLSVGRKAPGGFSEGEIALLGTFAAQAIIAIENVRLFTELGERNRDLAETLKQQTATADILRVISQSPTDVQPVFDTILRSAVQLSGALMGGIYRFDGELTHVRGLYGMKPEAALLHARDFPRPPDRGFVGGRAILERRAIQMPDALEDPEFRGKEFARAAGWRSSLSVPMLRDGLPIGAITVARAELGLVPETIVALLRTFADQAVIAIENVRLFTELGERNRDLTVALDQQTATSEILRVISSSQTDVQPVFDAIVRSVVRLCGADHSYAARFDGEMLHPLAFHGFSAEALEFSARSFPMRPSRETVIGRAALTRATASVSDTLTESDYARTFAVAGGWRSTMAVPMLRDGNLIGAIAVGRTEPGPFPDQHVELLKTFADQAVIAIENVRLFTELQEKNGALTQAHAQVSEALEQQTATAEILRVISRSQTDVQPVFDTIVRSAVRLCGGLFSALYQFDGELIHLAAQHNYTPEALEVLNRIYPTRPSPAGGAGRAIMERAVVHIPDVELDPELQHQAVSRAVGSRSGLFVPMLREGAPIGVIVVRRAEPQPFSDSEIELLRTFADQAVIAIENVRLFTELQSTNRELTTALDQQTATSNILRVISQSQTDVQPVFDAIVTSAVRLLGAYTGAVTRIAGDQIALAALTGHDAASAAAVRAPFPVSLQSELPHAQAVRDRVFLNIADYQTDPRLSEALRASAATRGYRSLAVVPMLLHDQAIGAIGVTRREPGGFTDDEVALLKTFADQAVIAIENVRLFKELEERNRDLTESLEQQTATAEILRVISQSQTDVQPVFDAIVRSAVRLCNGLFSTLYQFDGEVLYPVAQHNFTPEALEAMHRVFPARPTRALFTGRAILERAMVHIPDVEVDPEHQDQGLSHAVGWRSGIWVPLLREGTPIGVIGVSRAKPGPFSDSEIELLKTFADQAVIAVENVRLFKELEARTGELTQSVEKLTALGEVSRAVNSTLDVETVLDTIVTRASQLAGAAGCSIYEYDEGAQQFELRATHHDDPAFVAALRAAPLRKGEGLMGRAAEMREPMQIPDITQPGAYRSSVRDTLTRFGYRALLAVPLLREDQIIGSLSLTRKTPGEYAPEVIDVLKSFATQSALAIQNARLFREIADKSAQLEAASRHKSEFLANMSHELRTPLNAIIGFSEILAEKMFGDINEKQTEYLQDILESGRHLLSLINDILDLSKIEAGRMELERSDFDLPTAIENSLILVRERASRRGIRLGSTVDERLGVLSGDERKVKQVLLNLLSNALKFTPEGGRIDVAARRDGEMAEVSVADTGIGIAPEDQAAVFEEFRQVGTADKKAEGTGLGLALSRKFIELHGGRIWVQSQLGAGSTFSFTLPLRRT